MLLQAQFVRLSSEGGSETAVRNLMLDDGRERGEMEVAGRVEGRGREKAQRLMGGIMSALRFTQ